PNETQPLNQWRWGCSRTAQTESPANFLYEVCQKSQSSSRCNLSKTQRHLTPTVYSGLSHVARETKFSLLIDPTFEGVHSCRNAYLSTRSHSLREYEWNYL